MKNTTRKGRLIATVVLVCILAANAVQAQNFYSKELKTESDGFRWYEYTYEKNANGKWPNAAFDINGNRLTPTTDYLISYRDGYFEVWIRNDSRNNHVYLLYDKKGNCVVPDRGFNDISLIDAKDGFFIAGIFDNQYKTIQTGVFDKNGNCIISEKLGYTWIGYYKEHGLFWCRKGEQEHTISRDGMYYTEEFMNNKEFNSAAKKPVPNRTNTTNAVAKQSTTPKPSTQTQTSPQSQQSNNNNGNSQQIDLYNLTIDQQIEWMRQAAQNVQFNFDFSNMPVMPAGTPPPTTNTNSSYNSSSTSKSPSNQTASDLQNKQMDQRAYEGYADMLMNMCYGRTTYNDSNRLSYQKTMRELRMKWVNKGSPFVQSQWETWNGSRR